MYKTQYKDSSYTSKENENSVVMMGGEETETFKSWAQKIEESYQLQLALVVRLSAQAASAVDTNFLEFSSNVPRGIYSVQAVSHRFWVNGCLSYFDRIPDGFYLIHGMDPYAWTISTDQQDGDQVPSFESLKVVDPSDDFSIDVILIDKSRDPGLKELHNMVLSLSSSWISTNDVIDQLANLVCNRMGGPASAEEEDFCRRWKGYTEVMKESLGSVVLPIGRLSIGLCVHRALLFKVLADLVNLPCRIAKGCKYCGGDMASSCLVQVGPDREYLVDLFEKPGALSPPDSSLNATSSILVSSPLWHPRFKTVKGAENLRTSAKLFFFDWHSLEVAFGDASSGTAIYHNGNSGPQLSKAFDMNYFDKNNFESTSSNNHESSLSPLLQRAAWNITHDRDVQMLNLSNSFPNAINSTHLVKGPVLPSPVLPTEHRRAHPIFPFSVPRPDTTNNLPFTKMNQSLLRKSSSELNLEEEQLDISWSELVLKKKIGEGSFGTVLLAEWRGSDVAVKILMEQDFHAERFKEFLKEVALMKRLRHPNIVLFMGAVTQPPNLSIVTEYLSRGSLYQLLRTPDAELILKENLRLNMAYDVAKGMNYLHQLRPPIVHRDLKSPNLLVDGTYTVKVCDFGLSRSKANTYLSSKTAAGTPEWMAPEVLRNEPSNEKSDVYSFGVILWELVTLQRPWRNLNPQQVVAEVGFRGKRLEIPSNVNPVVAALIETCWDNEPSRRPSFSYIMESLQQLIINSTW